MTLGQESHVAARVLIVFRPLPKSKRIHGGRDHHGRCFSSWMAGGGIKAGISHGVTDELCYNVEKDPVPIRDFHATLLHCLGLDHDRLSYRFQGLDQRLTGVGEEARVVREILA